MVKVYHHSPNGYIIAAWQEIEKVAYRPPQPTKKIILTSIERLGRLGALSLAVVAFVYILNWLVKRVAGVVWRHGGQNVRGSSAKTQPRDPKTKRFIKRDAAPLAEVKFFPMPRPIRKASHLTNLMRLISHYRVEIAYVIVCLVAGAIGGYLGVKVGLEGLGI
jgi:hypothetical protein